MTENEKNRHRLTHNKAFVITHEFYNRSYLYPFGSVPSRDRRKRYWIPGKSLDFSPINCPSMAINQCVPLVPNVLVSLPSHLGFHDDLPCNLSLYPSLPEPTHFDPKMEAAYSSETSSSAHKITLCHSPVNHNLKNQITFLI
jgi:hypothetical protein